MIRNNNFVKRKIGTQFVIVAVGEATRKFNGMISVNGTGSFIWDCLENHITMDELAEQFPEEVIEVLKLLTHREDVPYFDYVRSVKANPIAVKIKLADIAHNSDQSRCPEMSEAHRQYFRHKYETAKAILTEGD